MDHELDRAGRALIFKEDAGIDLHCTIIHPARKEMCISLNHLEMLRSKHPQRFLKATC
jgi:hypothetical protein